MSKWIPSISNIPGPRYLALVLALQQDIIDGKLEEHFRLPTHRELAKNMGLTVGTISRAYSEAEKRGLTYAEVGRGTFVKRQNNKTSQIEKAVERIGADGVIDLAILRGNEPIYRDFVRKGLVKLAALPDLYEYMSFVKSDGFLEQRQSACKWLMNYGIPNVKPRNIIFTSGAQHAISSAIAALTEPGELILCEEIFYTGIKGVSTQLHRRKLMGVPIDEYGIIPEKLREICELNKVKILVCCPNHQNPTTVTLTLERRIEIVKIAREFDLKIIEDDVFNYMSSDIPSLVELAPERTVYVTGMSKSLFVGMRLGVLYTKASFFEPIATAVRTSIWTPSSLIMQLFSMWVEEGTAFKLADAQANEARERQILARQILEGANLSDNHICSHLWLILPLEWELQSFLDTLQRNKVSVVSGDLFMMARLNPQKPSAIRISLLAPDTRKELIFGLKIIQKILKSPKHVPEFLMI